MCVFCQNLKLDDECMNDEELEILHGENLKLSYDPQCNCSARVEALHWLHNNRVNWILTFSINENWTEDINIRMRVNNSYSHNKFEYPVNFTCKEAVDIYRCPVCGRRLGDTDESLVGAVKR